MERVGERVRGQDPIVVYPHAEEASGRNAIPVVYANRVAARFRLQIDPDIVQVTRARRTAATGDYRLLNRVEFDGPVVAGRSYLIADDHVTQGGTIADLRAYIEGQGGHVIGATTLTASHDSERLGPPAGLIAQLRREHPELEAVLQQQKGSDFAGLTRSEAHFLRNRPDILGPIEPEGNRGTARGQPGEGAPGTETAPGGEADRQSETGIEDPEDRTLF